MTKYDDFFDFDDCYYGMDKLDDYDFEHFDSEFPYSNYIADLKKEGLSDEEVAEKVKETEKDLEWGFKLASIQHMQSELHEKHEIHMALTGIISQLNGLYKNTLNLDHDLTNVSDTIAWHVGSVADKLGDED